MKNLLKLNGSIQLSKKELRAIKGGWDEGGGPCNGDVIGQVATFYCKIGAYGFEWWGSACYACK